MTHRTGQQNKCLHEGLRHLADELNERGLDMKAVLPTIDIPWTMESAKEYLFNRIAKIMFDGRTSSELNTTEMQQVWDVLMRHTGEKHGVYVEWPTKFNNGGSEEK